MGIVRSLSILTLACAVVTPRLMAQTPDNEPSLVIIIPAYNAADHYRKNLTSVFNQKYTNYRIIYIDDGSHDDTAHLAHNFLQTYYHPSRYTFTHHDTHRGPLACIYEAVHSCADDDIIVILRGVDFFNDSSALTTISHEYTQKNIWLTFGTCFLYPDNVTLNYKAPNEAIVKLCCFREYYEHTWHPCTFYAGLFKHIPLESFLANSDFVSAFWPGCCAFALLEMAGSRFSCITDHFYAFNHRIDDSSCTQNYEKKEYEESVRSAAHVPPVTELPSSTTMPTLDVIISAGKNLHNFLTSSLQHVPKHTTIHALCPKKSFSSGNNTPSAYTITLTAYDEHNDLADLLTSLLSTSSAEYVLLARDTSLALHDKDIAKAIALLDQTHAYAFYLDDSITQQLPARHAQLNGVACWQYKNLRGAPQPYTFDGAIYRREALLEVLRDITAHTIEEIEALCNHQNFSLTRVGLCFEKQMDTCDGQLL